MRRGFTAFSFALAAAFTAAVAWLACRGSHFFRDDFAGFHLVRHESFWRAALTPIDVHFVPLHRLVNEFVYGIAPLDFRVALLLLALAHVAGVIGLYATLERLKPSPVNPLLVAVYATNVYLGVLFLWWTSGLHRLPFVALAVFALYHWLGYRRGGGGRSLFWSAACVAGAFGFYSKAPLIPLTFLAVEVALWPDTPDPLRLRNLRSAGALLAAGAGIAFLASLPVDARFSELHLDPAFLAAFELRSLAILGEGLLGVVGGGNPGAWPLLVLGAAIAATCLLRPWNAVVWAVGFAVVAASIGVIGVSHRTAKFGLTAALSYRYYFELMYLVVVFTALALHGISLPEAARRFVADRRWRAAGAIAAAVALAGYAAVSLSAFRSLLDTPRYQQYATARLFVTNLKAGMAALETVPREEVTFVDSLAPEVLTGRSVAHIRRYSDFLTIFGWEGPLDPDAPRLYQVTDAGVVRRVARPR